jgi:hypothetical protein
VTETEIQRHHDEPHFDRRPMSPDADFLNICVCTKSCCRAPDRRCICTGCECLEPKGK